MQRMVAFLRDMNSSLPGLKFASGGQFRGYVLLWYGTNYQGTNRPQEPSGVRRKRAAAAKIFARLSQILNGWHYNRAIPLSAPQTISAQWKDLEGQSLGSCTLQTFIGGSDQTAVFAITRSNGEKAAIKLAPLDPRTSELKLSRLRQAMRLSHPHLLRIYDAGIGELQGKSLLYKGYLQAAHAPDDSASSMASPYNSVFFPPIPLIRPSDWRFLGATIAICFNVLS